MAVTVDSLASRAPRIFSIALSFCQNGEGVEGYRLCIMLKRKTFRHKSSFLEKSKKKSQFDSYDVSMETNIDVTCT